MTPEAFLFHALGSNALSWLGRLHPLQELLNLLLDVKSTVKLCSSLSMCHPTSGGSCNTVRISLLHLLLGLMPDALCQRTTHGHLLQLCHAQVATLDPTLEQFALGP